MQRCLHWRPPRLAVKVPDNLMCGSAAADCLAAAGWPIDDSSYPGLTPEGAIQVIQPVHSEAEYPSVASHWLCEGPVHEITDGLALALQHVIDQLCMQVMTCCAALLVRYQAIGVCSHLKVDVSSPTGSAVALSMTSMRMMASHLSFSMSLTSYACMPQHGSVQHGWSILKHRCMLAPQGGCPLHRHRRALQWPCR